MVIPTLNEASNIREVLDTLRADGATDGSELFVVCDGRSSDGTPDIVLEIAAEDARVRLLQNPRILQSGAVNLAVRTFGEHASVLVRCDAHSRYPRHFVKRLLASLERHAADAVVVPMDSAGDSCTRRAIAWVSDSKLGSGGSAHRGGSTSGWVDHGHHAAFRMRSFRRAGGYDETLSHNEDAELDCRQRALGGRIYLDADIRLAYWPRPTLASLWRQYFNYGRGRSRTIRKHPDSWRLRQLAVPVHVSLSMAALLASPWAPVLLAWPAFYGLVLALTSAQMAVRHRSRCGLLTGPAAFVMHTSWGLGFLNGMIRIRERPWASPPAAQVPGEELRS